MARRARKKSRTGIYHIVVRGVNRQTIFESDEDKLKFLEIIQKYKQLSKYNVFGYCLMDNHVHLLIRENEESISKSFQRISSSYVYWFNRKYERSGHLFQERFHSETVENKRYFLTVLRYIHQNPQKARLVNTVFESPWTSIHDYLNEPRIADVNVVLQLFSADRKQALEKFKQFMQEENDDECLDVIERIQITDNEVREYMKKLGIHNSSYLQQLELTERNEVIAHLKSLEGVSIRQLARITGISKTVIHRIAQRNKDKYPAN